MCLSPREGIYRLTWPIHRRIPTSTNNITHETIHPSVRQQKNLLQSIKDDIEKNPNLVCSLTDLEDRVKSHWVFPRAVSSPVDASPVSPLRQKRGSWSTTTSEVVKKMKISEQDSRGVDTGHVVYVEKTEKSIVKQSSLMDVEE